MTYYLRQVGRFWIIYRQSGECFRSTNEGASRRVYAFYKETFYAAHFNP